MHKFFKTLHHWTIPYEGNDHKPHIIRHRSLHFYSAVILLTKIFLVVSLFVIYPSAAQFSTITSNHILELVNKERVTRNLPALTLSTELNKAAESKAQDMIVHNYFSHTSPDGVKPWEWFKTVNYDYTYAGENLALNFVEAEDAFKAWMNSPSHRDNIINPNYQEMGLAVKIGQINNKQATVVVQLFGTQLNSGAAPSESPQVAGEIATTTVASENLPSGATVIKENENSSFLSHVIRYGRDFLAIIGFFILINLLITIFVRIKIQHKPIILHSLAVIALVGLMYLAKMHFIEGIGEILMIS